MAGRTNYFEKWDVKSLKGDLDGLCNVYREIADEIGIENAIIIFNLFRGMQVTFPNRLFSREYIYEAILKEYDGNNVAFLAKKYNYSERTVWRILKNKQTDEV